MKPKAVVFDIGNVLIDWQPERMYDAEIGAERRRAMFAEVDLYAMNADVDCGVNFLEAVTKLADANPKWQAEIMLWHDRWLDMASPAIEHTVRLMAALQAQKIPVFSLTNFGVQTYDLAATVYPFLRQFDRDFISGHMQVIKPAARIYQLLEDETGLDGPDLLFTDDRLDNIQAAEARGWQTHQFKHPQGWADRLVAEGLLTKDQAQ